MRVQGHRLETGKQKIIYLMMSCSDSYEVDKGLRERKWLVKVLGRDVRGALPTVWSVVSLQGHILSKT